MIGSMSPNGVSPGSTDRTRKGTDRLRRKNAVPETVTIMRETFGADAAVAAAEDWLAGPFAMQDGHREGGRADHGSIAYRRFSARW